MLQKIQNLENSASMAIQGTQVPMYTNTPFLYFSDFSIFIGKHKKKKKKKILKVIKQKHVKQSNA